MADDALPSRQTGDRRGEQKTASIDGFTEQFKPEEMEVPSIPLPIRHDFMEELLMTTKVHSAGKQPKQ